jgi:hypothetical protein
METKAQGKLLHVNFARRPRDDISRHAAGRGRRQGTNHPEPGGLMASPFLVVATSNGPKGLLTKGEAPGSFSSRRIAPC